MEKQGRGGGQVRERTWEGGRATGEGSGRGGMGATGEGRVYR